MAMSVSPVEDRESLKRHLEKSIIVNSGFLWRVFGSGDKYELYATDDLGAALAIQDNGAHVIFSGDWVDAEIPFNVLPPKEFFVSASPPSAIDKLKNHYELTGEWPCWLFLAPAGYGKGEWDEIGPIKPDEVPYIAPLWELGDDDREEHIRESVRRFDSACLRIGGKPVSWCGLHFDTGKVGNLGFAHTLAEHRRKGYQVMVTKALVNRLAGKGVRATADVIKNNTASMHTCKSMDFEIICEQTWAGFKLRE